MARGGSLLQKGDKGGRTCTAPLPTSVTAPALILKAQPGETAANTTNLGKDSPPPVCAALCLLHLLPNAWVNHVGLLQVPVRRLLANLQKC